MRAASWKQEGVQTNLRDPACFSDHRSLLRLQPVVTRHLVFRGNYQNLSLVIYGATIPDEVKATKAEDAKPKDLLLLEAAPSPAIQQPASQRLRCLSLSPLETGRSSWLPSLLSAGEEWAQSGRPGSGHRASAQTLSSIAEAANHVEAATLGVAFGSGAEGPGGELSTSQRAIVMHMDSSVAEEAEEDAVRLVLHWLAEGGPMLPAGLCASLVACADTATCYRFLAYGGAALLVNVLTDSGVAPAMKLRVLTCLSRVSSHGFGCEALLGWWVPGARSGTGPKRQALGTGAKPEPMEVDEDQTGEQKRINGSLRPDTEVLGPSKAYGALLSILLKPQPRRVALLSARLLKRLKLYELAADFSRVGRQILFPEARLGEALPRGRLFASVRIAADLLQEIVAILLEGNTPLGEWPPPVASLANSADLTEVPLRASYGHEATSVQGANDPTLWALLRERQLLPMLAALLSVPAVRSAEGGTARAAATLLSAMWALALPLLETRAGLLFLAEQPEAVAVLVSALEGSTSKQDRSTSLEHERAVPRRQLATMLGLGAAELCSGCQLARLVREGVRAVLLLDSLLAASKVLVGKGGQSTAAKEGGGSEAARREQSMRQASVEALSAAKELSQLATAESSRQAVVAALSFPEALPGLIQLLMQQGPQAPSSLASSVSLEDHGLVQEASILPHYVGLVCLALLTDPSPATLPVFAPQGLHLQAAIMAQGAKPSSPSPQNPASDSETAAYPLTDVLNSWIAPTVVWKKEGPLALLQLLAVLTGLRKGPAAELGFNLHGYELAHGPDDADLGLASKEDLDRGLFAAAAAAANATVALRLLASLAIHPVSTHVPKVKR